MRELITDSGIIKKLVFPRNDDVFYSKSCDICLNANEKSKQWLPLWEKTTAKVTFNTSKDILSVLKWIEKH